MTADYRKSEKSGACYLVTTEQFEQAANDFKIAKSMESQAEKLRKVARQVILDYAAQAASPFVIAPDSESGKTVECKTGNGLTARITRPMAAAKPSRFDQERTQEAYDLFRDVDSLLAEHLFRLNPEFRIDQVMSVPADKAKQVAGLLMQFALPAEPERELTPRVEVK